MFTVPTNKLVLIRTHEALLIHHVIIAGLCNVCSREQSLVAIATQPEPTEMRKLPLSVSVTTTGDERD